MSFKRHKSPIVYQDYETLATRVVHSNDTEEEMLRETNSANSHSDYLQTIKTSTPEVKHRVNSISSVKHIQTRQSSISPFCFDCEKQSKAIQDLQASLQSSQNKVFLTEKHLKQYDNLLKLKDERLKETEAAIAKDKEALAEQKKKIISQKLKLEEEKSKLLGEKEKMMKERQELNQEFEILEQKNLELQEIMKECKVQKEEINSFKENQESLSANFRENLLISREEEIQRLFDEAYLFKTETDEGFATKYSNYGMSYEETEEQITKLQEKEQQLLKFEKKLLKIKEKMMRQQEISCESLENKARILKIKEKALEKEKKKVQDAQQALERDLQMMERMKSSIRDKEDSIYYEKLMLNDSGSTKEEISPCKSRRDMPPLALNEIKEIKTEENTIITNPELVDEVSFLKTSLLESEERLKQAQNLIASLENEKKELISSKTSKKHSESIAVNTDPVAEKPQDPKETTQNLELNAYRSRESLLKLKVSELESFISVEGSKLQNQLANALHKISELEKKLALQSSQLSKLEDEKKELLLQNAFLSIEYENSASCITLQVPNIDDPDSSRLSLSMSDKISELKGELEVKLKELKLKEKELAGIEESLAKEKGEVIYAADCVKNIGEDLNRQQKEIEKERVNIMGEKLKIAGFNKKLEEKSSALEIKERELLYYKGKLDEREKLISEVERNQGSRLLGN